MSREAGENDLRAKRAALLFPGSPAPVRFIFLERTGAQTGFASAAKSPFSCPCFWRAVYFG